MYCGIDVIEVNRIREAINNTPKFKETIFTKNEIEDIEKGSEKLKYQRYAGRFASKEAVFKAICEILVNNNITINLCDIEVVNMLEIKRKPKVNILNEKAKKVLNEYIIDVSITHIEEIAEAICMVTRK